MALDEGRHVLPAVLHEHVEQRRPQVQAVELVRGTVLVIEEARVRDGYRQRTQRVVRCLAQPSRARVAQGIGRGLSEREWEADLNMRQAIPMHCSSGLREGFHGFGHDREKEGNTKQANGDAPDKDCLRMPLTPASHFASA